MMEVFSNFLRMIRGTVRGIDSSRQLALGVMLGMVVGLLPKDSLLPYGFVVLMILSRANLVSGAVSILFFAWIGNTFDPVTHRIGEWVLTFDPLESTWAWLYQLPVAPWTRFDNTVVMGNIVITFMIAYPIYRISLYFFDHYGSTLAERFAQGRFVQWFVGDPIPQPREEG